MKKKVYDCFCFNGEWDMLEIHLNTHDPVVNYFVIVESVFTFVGRPKEPKFNINDPRVADFSHKIRYILVSDFPNESVWGNEAFQRNAIYRGLWDAEPLDLILICDCDEIIRPEYIQAAVDKTDYKFFGFQQVSYFTFLNNCNVEGCGPSICSVGVPFEALKTATADYYRQVIRVGAVEHLWWWHDAGWHLSYIMTKEEIIEKVQNFSHQEFNNPSVLSKIDPIKRARAGQDILGREHCSWRLVPFDSVDLPAYVRQNLNKYQKYFLEP
jgi:beta-1,4-mannosyl-glycoprotein beta-1,4-N-acetylglucosaminyltransferase